MNASDVVLGLRRRGCWIGVDENKHLVFTTVHNTPESYFPPKLLQWAKQNQKEIIAFIDLESTGSVDPAIYGPDPHIYYGLEGENHVH
jgi:hypothetical protein